MNGRKQFNQRGVTLIEIIIVIAMIGILTGGSVLFLGHLHYADTEKVVKTLDSALDELQVKNMSKADTYYMYVYDAGNGYYMKTMTDDLTSFDSSKLDTDGIKLANHTIEIYGIGNDASGSRITLDGTTNYIKISYTKSASFQESETNVKQICIDGMPEYSISLVFDTGKHFIDP